jgi:hypothetical protein
MLRSKIMVNYTMLVLSCFSGAIAVGFAVVMIFGEGQANINANGEGWIEVLIAGGLAISGFRGVRA